MRFNGPPAHGARFRRFLSDGRQRRESRSRRSSKDILNSFFCREPCFKGKKRSNDFLYIVVVAVVVAVDVDVKMVC